MSKFYAENYFQEGFLSNLAKASLESNEDGDRVLEFLNNEKIDFSQDRSILEKATAPGMTFDVRYAGGAYKVDSSTTGHSELFLNCVDRTIFVDGAPVQDQAIHGDQVSFATEDGHRFDITFEAKVGEESLVSGVDRSFSGRVEPVDGSAAAGSVSGSVYYPWEDVLNFDFDDSHQDPLGESVSGEQPSAAEMARDSAAHRHPAVAFDLIPSGITDINSIQSDMLEDSPGRSGNLEGEGSSIERQLPPGKKLRQGWKSWARQHLTNISPRVIAAITIAAVGPSLLVTMASLGVGYGAEKGIRRWVRRVRAKVTQTIERKQMLQNETFNAIVHDVIRDYSANNTPISEAQDALETRLREAIRAEIYEDIGKEFELLKSLQKSKFISAFTEGEKNWVKRYYQDQIEEVKRTIVENRQNNRRGSSSAGNIERRIREAMKEVERERDEKYPQLNPSAGREENGQDQNVHSEFKNDLKSREKEMETRPKELDSRGQEQSKDTDRREEEREEEKRKEEERRKAEENKSAEREGHHR